MFARALLADFAHGNPRLERAIEHVVRSIPRDPHAILDIGCGVGWSTWEVHRSFPNAQVVGVDLSTENIAIAERLFEHPAVRFEVADVTCPEWKSQGPFDAIFMCDVYEHIPADARERFDLALGSLLAPDSVIVLTFPSEGHQEHLAHFNPSGLQPVDEIIAPETLDDLAARVGGVRRSYDPVSIWNRDDYIHAVVTRGTPFDHPSGSTATLESQRARYQRVRRRLNVRVTRDGMLIPDGGGDGPSVLVATPNRAEISETFIRAHIEALPTRVEVLFGHVSDPVLEDGTRLMPLWARALGRLAYTLTRRSDLRERIRQSAVRRMLASRKVQVILAEYGTTAADYLGCAISSRIPLVAHFHGFDAYDDPTIQTYTGAYATLFEHASAIVAVSDAMRRRLIAMGAPEDVLHVIPCGADTTLFTGANPEEVGPAFLAVGRFVDKKGPHLTILAFQLVLQQVPEARLVMAGDGGLLEACRSLVHALGIADSVTFTGVQTPLQVAELMRRSRAFVQHSVTASYGDSEGTPVAVLEAGASGIPVVATRHGGIAEVVIHGETGYLVEEGDIKAMARWMTELAQDPYLASRLGRAASAHVRENHALGTRAAELWEVIDRVMRKTRPHADVRGESSAMPGPT